MFETEGTGGRFGGRVTIPAVQKGDIMAEIEAYCMKCKAKKTMKDPEQGTTKNGKPIAKGKCPDCGSTICRIGAIK